jgi:hypothetical protein
LFGSSLNWFKTGLRLNSIIIGNDYVELSDEEWKSLSLAKSGLQIESYALDANSAKSVQNFLRRAHGTVPWAETAISVGGAVGFTLLFPGAGLPASAAFATSIDQLSSLVSAGQASASELAMVIATDGIIRKVEFLIEAEEKSFLRLDYIYSVTVGSDKREYLLVSSVYPVKPKEVPISTKPH